MAAERGYNLSLDRFRSELGPESEQAVDERGQRRPFRQHEQTTQGNKERTVDVIHHFLRPEKVRVGGSYQREPGVSRS